MVKGLKIFSEHFLQYTNRYILIGGTACDLSFNRAGLSFRATRDLDIVLCTENMDKEFVRTFWKFINNGKYMQRKQGVDKRQYYRFSNPETDGYPVMIELFSRKPDALLLSDRYYLTPLPVDDDISSLSAILVNDDYYHFLFAGRRETENLSYIGPEHLIPLKAKAWLDLTARKAQGELIDGKSIKKHKNDIFRLYQILNPVFHGELSVIIRNDLIEFLSRMEIEIIDLKSLGLGSTNLGLILNDFRRIYDLE
ncbi:hypothetical protein K8T06_17915 [bacterium]|nr:hypothetical protein [bacterium]